MLASNLHYRRRHDRIGRIFVACVGRDVACRPESWYPAENPGPALHFVHQQFLRIGRGPVRGVLHGFFH